MSLETRKKHSIVGVLRSVVSP